MFPQMTLLTLKLHTWASTDAAISEQTMLVRLVLLGQLPQLDAMIAKVTCEQFEIVDLHMKVSCSELASIKLMFIGGRSWPGQ